MASRGPRRLFKSLLPEALCSRCFYCGDGMTCRDHYLPWAAYGVSYWLPACQSCNATLSDNVFDTLGARLRWLRRRFYTKHRKKFGRDMRLRLDGTDGDLRAALLAELAQTSYLEARLAWMEAVEASCDAVGAHTLHLDAEAVLSLSDALHALQRSVEGT